MALEPTKHVNGRMWQTGQSKNPKERPAGSRSVFSQAATEAECFYAARLGQHGFDLLPHPFKVTAQLDDDGTVREVRTVHVVGYEGYSKPPPK